jgi:hypothetical protein
MLRLQVIETVDRAFAATNDRGFFAPEQLGRSRRLTPEGYLVCEGVPIARTGTHLYHEQDLSQGGESAIKGDSNGVISVRRPDEEVFRPETVASFEGKSITIEHPPEFIGPHNQKEHEVGHMQNVRRGTGSESDLLLADLLVKDPQAIAYVNRELPQLSSGYDAGYEQDRPGQAVQRNIVGNHVALVRRGRAGPRVTVRDSINGETFMTTRDAVLNPLSPGKIINTGMTWEGGGLKPRIDQLEAELKAVPWIWDPSWTCPVFKKPDDYPAFASPENALDSGERWTGAMKTKASRVLDALQALERAVADAKEHNTVGTRDAAARGPNPFGRVVTPAELNKQSREFYDKGPQVTPTKGPNTPAKMNAQAAELYGKGAA